MKFMTASEVINYRSDVRHGENMNPNMNDVLRAGIEGDAEELFYHAWLQSRSIEDMDLDTLIICCEGYDRELSSEEGKELIDKIRGLESALCAFYGKVYLEIENYL